MTRTLNNVAACRRPGTAARADPEDGGQQPALCAHGEAARRVAALLVEVNVTI